MAGRLQRPVLAAPNQFGEYIEWEFLLYIRMEHQLLTPKQRELGQTLLELGQAHLFDWPLSPADNDKQRLLQQLEQLDGTYPGGLRGYVTAARQLLADSKAGVNPLDGWQPSKPKGEVLEFGSGAYEAHEAAGVAELDGCAFVLVAGGLGERLGFSGIKVALPTQISTDATYLSHYAQTIAALQDRALPRANGLAPELPLAIMVSDDTATRTQALLEANDHFGLSAAQVTLLKQEKVACLEDNEARLALDPKARGREEQLRSGPVLTRGPPAVPTAG